MMAPTRGGLAVLTLLLLAGSAVLAGADGPAEGTNDGGGDGVEAKADEAPPEPSAGLAEQKAPAVDSAEPPPGGDGKGIASERQPDAGADSNNNDRKLDDKGGDDSDSDDDAEGREPEDEGDFEGHDGLENDPIAEAFHQHEFLPECVRVAERERERERERSHDPSAGCDCVPGLGKCCLPSIHSRTCRPPLFLLGLPVLILVPRPHPRFPRPSLPPARYVLTMDIVGARTECVYEEVSGDQVPTKFRAAYFTSTGGDLLLDAHFYADKGTPGLAADEELYATAGKTESLVMSDIKSAGTYRLCFTNHQSGVTKRTTFAIHIGVDPPKQPEGHAKEEHVHGLNAVVGQLDSKVDGIDSEQRYYLARMHRNHYTQESTQGAVMWYTILESALMIGVTVAQVYYVRHLINSRSWV